MQTRWGIVGATLANFTYHIFEVQCVVTPNYFAAVTPTLLAVNAHAHWKLVVGEEGLGGATYATTNQCSLQLVDCPSAGYMGRSPLRQYYLTDYLDYRP
jgi:hypothetical protein